jgi:hypothetical protein
MGREERGDSIARQHLFTNKTYIIHWIMLFKQKKYVQSKKALRK